TPLVINYTENGVNKSISVDIPLGRYSADEIADMIDDELYEREPSLIIGVNPRGQFSIQCEGGYVNYVSGPGRTLFYEEREGSQGGYLLGVTKFLSDTAQLHIEKDKNDTLQFRIEGDEDTVYEMVLTPNDPDKPAVGYTYNELCEEMNRQFEKLGLGDTVEAAPYFDGETTVIGLKSEKAITGLEGNFLMLGDDFKSPLYDISNYSAVENKNAKFSGAKDLGDTIDILRDRNDYFVINVSYYAGENDIRELPIKVDLLGDVDEKTYTKAELADRMNEQIADAFKAAGVDNVPVTADVDAGGNITFETTQYGDGSKVDLDQTQAPSGYMVYDLFKTGNLKSIKPNPADSTYTAANVTGNRNITSEVIDSDHNKLQYTVEINDMITKDHGKITLDFTLAPGTYNGSSVVTELNRQLAEQWENKLAAAGLDGLNTDITFEIVNGGLRLGANGENGSSVSDIDLNTNQSVSTAYRKLIRGVTYSGGPAVADGSTTIYKESTNTSSVQATHGANAGEDYLTPGSNSSSRSETGAFMTYEAVDPISAKGEGGENTDVVGEQNGKPATLTFPGALSQFVDTDEKKGVCLRDTTISFTVDTGSGTVPVSVSAAKGSTYEDLYNSIITASKGSVTIVPTPDKFTGSGDLVLTSTARGSYVHFDRYGGNIAAVGQQHRPANSTVDYNSNTYSVPPSLTLGSVSTHFPLEINGSNNKIVLNVGGSMKTVTLDTGSTINSVNDIVDAINKQVDSVTASAYGSSGITIRGGEGITGDLVFDASSTCHIDQRYNKSAQTTQPGTLTLPQSYKHFPITVRAADNNNTLTFTYDTPDKKGQSVTVTIPDGTYSNASSLAAALNNKNNAGAVVPADALNDIEFRTSGYGSSSSLQIATKGMGPEYGFGSTVGGNSGLDKTVIVHSTGSNGVVTNDNHIKFPAAASNPYYSSLFSDPGLEIIAGKNDKIVISVTDPATGAVNPKAPDNVLTLTPGIYTNSNTIVSQIRNKFGSWVDVSVQSGGLVIKTKTNNNGAMSGTGAKID
ncbi:MAG: hypothetical protein NC401_19985, partial [Ruminococcus sp.]|nr:hypothetical protein [Ruminococcus sp.]